MNGLNTLYTNPEKYRNTPHQKMLHANLVLYVNDNGTIEIVKNRYSGTVGLIDHVKGIRLLVKLLVGITYNNTCEIFQEALRKDICKVLKEHKVLEGEENDKI